MNAGQRAEAGRVPPIAFVRGDATQPEGTGTRVIAHVCNDVGAWGAGFVLAVSKRWKAPELHYRENSKRLQLGAIQLFLVEPGIEVANMIAQRACTLDYLALYECLTILARVHQNREDVSFHMPRIGCGIAGGDWRRVEAIVYETLSKAGFPVTVYDLPPTRLVSPSAQPASAHG